MVDSGVVGVAPYDLTLEYDYWTYREFLFFMRRFGFKAKFISGYYRFHITRGLAVRHAARFHANRARG
jgi:hypothetical protein